MGSMSHALDCTHKKFQSVLDNYSVLQQLWKCALDNCVDPDVRARVNGVQSQMEIFAYFFGVCIGKLVLGHVDNLSAALQKSTISAAEGHRTATMTPVTASIQCSSRQKLNSKSCAIDAIRTKFVSKYVRQVY